MTMISAISTRACDSRVEDLRAEFGGILADRIIEAEALDFLWEGRISERYLGQHVAAIEEDDLPEDLSRVAVLSSIAGQWHVGLCLVDGEGAAIDLLWKRHFDGREEAEVALQRGR